MSDFKVRPNGETKYIDCEEFEGNYKKWWYRFFIALIEEIT